MERVKGKRVLIVEDEPMIAVLLEDILQETGAQVIGVASTLVEAEAWAEEASVDAAVLDINLKGHMSYPAAERLRLRGIPFIFVTGFARDQVPDRLSAVPIVAKPYCLADIAFGLNRVLSARAAA